MPMVQLTYGFDLYGVIQCCVFLSANTETVLTAFERRVHFLLYTNYYWCYDAYFSNLRTLTVLTVIISRGLTVIP